MPYCAKFLSLEGEGEGCIKPFQAEMRAKWPKADIFHEGQLNK